MHINYDLCDTIADVDIRCRIKKYDWLINPISFVYIGKKDISDIDINILRSMIIDDVPEVALWFALNYPLDIYAYLTDESFDLIYNAGLISDFSKKVGINMIYHTFHGMKKPDISINLIRTITKHYPELHDAILAHAITKGNMNVIKWIEANYCARFVSHMYLAYLRAPEAVINYYKEKNGKRFYDADNVDMPYEPIKPSCQFPCI